MKKILSAFLLIIMCFSFPITASADNGDTWISEEAKDACIKYGEEYCICPELLMAIVEAESSGERYAENGSCKGLMQISVNWQKDRMECLGVNDIYDTDGNIHVGVDYLAELFEDYGEAATVLMVWHGERNAAEKAENGVISKYASRVLERSAELERLHGK